MVLTDPAKSGLESGVWIDGYIYQNKDKEITITNNKSLLYLLCSVSLQKPCDSPPCYCCDLGRHLEYFTPVKTTTRQSNSSNTIAFENYLKIVINCDFDFMKIAAVLDTILNISISEPNQYSTLIVCIIRPLNIHKKSKLKYFYQVCWSNRS